MMYLVMKVRKWEDLELEPLNGFLPAHIKPDEGDIGFCPVFSDKAKALDYANGDDSLVFPVQPKEKIGAIGVNIDNYADLDD